MSVNGWIQLAPRKGEFFLTPPENTLLSNNSWVELLAFHEYRHVIQFENTRQGMISLLSLFSGDLGWDAGYISNNSKAPFLAIMQK